MFWLKQIQIVERCGEFAVFYLVDDLHHLVIDGRRASYFAPECADDPVDGFHFGLLTFLYILKHAGFQAGVLANRNGDNKERNSLFYDVAKVSFFIISEKSAFLITSD